MADPDFRIAVYSGSFDPVTLGHLNVIQRGSKLVDKLVVGIGVNPEKKSLFTVEERVELVRQVTKSLDNVEVRAFSGLAVEFVRECGAWVMLRGVRALTDMEAELTMMSANRQLDPDVETVFLMADTQYTHVSSTLIKQIARMAGDEALSRFVPPEVVKALRKKMDATSNEG